jgi:transglutaminase-like putative cysteine protease
MKKRAEDTKIPRHPMLWLAVALVFTMPPMFGNLAWWVPACFMVALAAKFRMELRGWRLRSAALHMAMAAAVLVGVWITYRSLIGMEAGLSISLLLISIKILESHTARDFHVLALLGWFLCLTELFISQDLAAVLYALAGFVIVTVAVVRFHRGAPARGRIARPLLAGGGLVAQALPLVIALFFLFPRGNGGFRFELKRAFFNRTGMSDRLSPGSVASLAMSRDVAFRAEFPDGNVIPPGRMYWRGAVLTQDHGLAWTPAATDSFREGDEHLGGTRVRQQIVIQPHGAQWVFSLDWPGTAPSGTRLLAGNVLRASQRIYSPRRYEVVSYLNNEQKELWTQDRKTCLQFPKGVSPRIRELVNSWTKSTHDPHELTARALNFFRKGNFTYSLSPGEYGTDAMDDFLFQRKTGFCEHYAAAFATLMRMAGVPSRVVLGYQGGEFNTLGSYLVVRQSDAHAWCEIWVAGSGWQRVDPTMAVAPGSMNAGFTDSGANSAAGLGGAAGTQIGGVWTKYPFLRTLQLAWDTVNYEWDSHVANFDEDEQQSFLLSLGMVDTRPLKLLGWLVLVAGLLLGLQLLRTWWKARPASDPLKGLYGRFCRHLAGLGVQREPWEGPTGFACRAAALLPDQAAPILRVADIFATLRYSRTPEGIGEAELEQEVRAFCRGRQGLAGRSPRA